jgi:hypothetical protein
MWVASVPTPRLIVLDTLAGVRPDRSQRETTYDGDYKALLGIQRMANEGGYTVLVLHHTRKMEADDPLDTISGTLGTVGCADTGAVLAKGPAGATLYVRGRDVEEAEHALSFDRESCRWSVLGEAAEVRRSDTRNKILEALLTGTEMSRADIAEETGLNSNVVGQQLHQMVKAGEVARPARGVYLHPSKLRK